VLSKFNFISPAKAPSLIIFFKINNSGVFLNDLVKETKSLSLINLVDTFLPLLKKSKENNSIIITSAIAGLERLSAPESYSCAKTALSSYVPHLSKYLSTHLLLTLWRFLEIEQY
jgi:NAD(P)-dependent dehydrogenase (short-subunit alcohol dehydrogenase family)